MVRIGKIKMNDKRRNEGNAGSFVDSIMAAKTTREKLRELCECDEVITDAEVFALGRLDRDTREPDDNASSVDEVDEILEAEYRRLNDALDLPVDTYSLTRINPNLPTCVKYGVRSGLTHQRMQKFSPLSRGFQGSAIAIAAFATTALIKARCWNELTIDQIVDDGDTYYCQSYEKLDTDDRRSLNVLDLKRELILRDTHRVYITVDEPAYAGTFRSDTPTELHVAKALELFFKRYDAGVLTSTILNVAMWKDSKYINIFDGQPRKENLSPTDDMIDGSAKLILVRDLIGLIFIILEKSNVNNEHFVIHGLDIRGVNRLTTNEDDPEEPEKTVGKPSRRPSGYIIQNKYRALVRGSFHLTHELVPAELRGHGHLVIALAALIYSRLINANKWTTSIIDLIFNQSHIYLVDLARVLEKKLDENFELKIDDAMGDVVLGVYAAKVKILINVIPGQAKKGKSTIDTGFRDFFAIQDSAIVEIKKKFYAVWKDGDKYYLFDPFGCDEEGFRVHDSGDPDDLERNEKPLACVTMNSTINELIETLLENTGNKEKDPFIMHGLRVLYVKTGSVVDGNLETVIYRDKKTNRRPLVQETPKSEPIDDCKMAMDTIPRPRKNAEKTKEAFNQYPELMRRVEDYAIKDDEPITFVESKSHSRDSHSKTVRSNDDDAQKNHTTDLGKDNFVPDSNQENPNVETVDEELDENESIAIKDESPIVEEVKFIRGYNMINPHRMILHGSMNCLAEEFDETSRGRQGVVLALTAMAYSKIKEPTTWRNLDVDQILRVGNNGHSDIVTWIREGSRDEDAREEEDEENDEEEDADAEEEEDATSSAGGPEKSRTFGGVLKPVPSHIDLSMIPDKIKLGENVITYKRKERIIEGEADPLANLGEALEHCLQKYDQVILENKQLIYGIWKNDEKYFTLNPYGSDEDGWRLRDYPASIVVTDTINELTDAFHGILEFNDRTFSLHVIVIESIQPGDKYIAADSIVINDYEIPEIYRTKFLPVTDQDLTVSQLESDGQAQTLGVEQQEAIRGGNVEENEDEEDAEEEEEEEEEDEDIDRDDQNEDNKDSTKEESEPAKPLEDPLLEIPEQERPDGPDRLNLSLLTGSVKIEKDELPNEENMEIIAYERLKYNHPPPYVVPPKKVLCVLLEAKRASQSMHSLISRFSIDSKLAVKAITDLPNGKTTNQPAITTVTSATTNRDDEKPVKIIKLPPTKYLFSRIPPEGYTPLRAIDENFIHDEVDDLQNENDCRKKKEKFESDEFVWREITDDSIGARVLPTIIPLGPTIRTPVMKKKFKPCPDGSKTRKCAANDSEKTDKRLKKILCNTENLLFDVIFPSDRTKIDDYDDTEIGTNSETDRDPEIVDSEVRVRPTESNKETDESKILETIGFHETDDKNVGIIEGNTCLKNRELLEDCHYKSCFYAAILCILAKVRTNVNNFSDKILDELTLASDKIYRNIGKLRYKPVRRFFNVVVNGSKCNVILKQTIYADPENWDPDELSIALKNYASQNKTGILVLKNASYAFWLSNDECYMFDPYACDDNGVAGESGYACLSKFCDIDVMIARIKQNNSATTKMPYRIYNLSISHIETITKMKKFRKKRKRCSTREFENPIDDEITEDAKLSESEDRSKRELSLMELAEWANNDETTCDVTLNGFTAMKNFRASAMEVAIVENDVTRPILAPFKKLKNVETSMASMAKVEPVRKRPYDRKFVDRSCLNTAIDLCVIAWSCVHDPTTWGVRTVRGIYEASRDLAFDSLLAAKDSTVAKMFDGVLSEFSIANYTFNVVFAPLHRGTLYASEGWNLAMSLKKLFDASVYSGAIVVCDAAHVGVMKKGNNHYAWWTISRTKKLRIITSECLEDFLKIVVGAVGEIEKKIFYMRVVTISYADKIDPDCTDLSGLHEFAVPSTSLPQIHGKTISSYDVDAIFRSTHHVGKPIFVIGTVATRNRDYVVEPRMKRCYFVGILSLMVKRDVVQSPVPCMIDEIIRVAENLYKQFDEPKYHVEHILRNLTIMNRIFDFRDCAGRLYVFSENSNNVKMDFFTILRKQLKIHLKKYGNGLLQFTNCCYGFWQSRSTTSRRCRYYYVDPYPCNANGRRTDNHGYACLAIFSSICQMARHMCENRCDETTGFFIHRIHVETINVPPYEIFQEDPMWIYLDYHWSFNHSIDNVATRRRIKKQRKNGNDDKSTKNICEKFDKAKSSYKSWNNYTIEVPNLIYSIWGTLGCYDRRFGDRGGHNRTAICVAIMAMRFICHPSKWGPAILDSAIICGDSYYTASLKKSTKKFYEDTSNSFNLQSRLKIHPHVWSIKFFPNTCGILYGAGDRPNLAKILKFALEISSDLVVECGKVTVSVLSCDDGYYVADPCWTGPPLFPENRGAVYALRCKNFNSMIYAVAKMFNTNLRLEFRVTPVVFDFDRESCDHVDGPERSAGKEILGEALGTRPGIADGPDVPVPGALTVTDEDSYPSYRRNVRMGMLNGRKFEDQPISSPFSRFDDEKIFMCDDYPRTIDLVHKSNGNEGIAKIFRKKKLTSKISSYGPMNCLGPKDFLQTSNRREFDRRNKEMADDFYKTYEHRTILNLVEDNGDDDDSPDVDENAEEETADNDVLPVESEIADNVDE